MFIIGVGNVGGTFIEQMRRQQSYLRDTHRLNVKIVGLANSTKMIFDEDGIDLDNWKPSLIGSKHVFNIDAFKEHVIQLNLRNSLFIDNTDSAVVAENYLYFFEHNISVVTPNKIACSSSFENYLKLKNVSVKKNSKFLFETNVGAGLPVISTINDLIKSGDQIQ